MNLSDAASFIESRGRCTMSVIYSGYFQVTADVLVVCMLSCLLDVVGILTAIPANLLVILAICRNASLHHNADYVILMLAVSNFLTSGLQQPLILVYKIEHLLNKPRCATVNILSTVRAISSHAAIISQMTVSLERTVAIMAPFWYEKWVSRRRLFAVPVLTWLGWTFIHLSSFWGLPYPVTVKVYFFFAAVCLLVTAVCYGLLVKVANHHESQVQAQQQHVQRSEEEKKKMKRERKALWTAIYISGAYFVGYLPFLFTLIIVRTVVNLSAKEIFMLRSWAGTLGCLIASVNPIILCWRNKRLGREMKKLLRLSAGNNGGVQPHVESPP